MIRGFTTQQGRHSLEEVQEALQETGWFDGYPYPIVMGIMGLLSRDTSKVHVTDLTSCLRRAYLERITDVYPSLKRMYWLFRGSLAHQLVENAREPFSLAEVRFQRRVDGVTVVGRPDKIVPNRRELYDYKTTKRITLKRLPYGEHTRQVNIYRWLVEPHFQIDRLFLVYLDMSRCAPLEVPVEEVEGYVIARARILQSAMQSGKVPEAEPSWLCDYCDVRGECEAHHG
jgi:CRISPR/Cas system-associated exonuclease Cas4 (RecB family)